MNEFAPIALVLLTGAMTPGPNNLLVWREAGRGGLRAALPAIAGIVAGSLLLLLLAVAGVAGLLAGHPAWRRALTIAGSLYLAWLGMSLLGRALVPARVAAPTATPGPGAPAGVMGLAAFQFLNPKSWVLVIAATGSAPASELATRLPWLLLLFGLIPLACLLLWAACGAALAGVLARPTPRRCTDGGMAVLILLCAGWLFRH